MPMKEKINHAINKVDEHLDIGSSLTEEQSKLLTELKAELNTAAITGQPPQGNVLNSIELLTVELEEDHPKATAVLKSLMNILSNIGV